MHIIHKESVHFPPHLHSGMEIVYVTRGTLILGVGCELYQMEKGDFAIVFPNLIHHYQVFGKGKKESILFSTTDDINRWIHGRITTILSKESGN